MAEGYCPIPFDDYVDLFFESLNSAKACNWCRHPNRKVLTRIGLCPHCNRIRKKVRRLESQLSDQRGVAHPILEFEHKRATTKADLCKLEGDLYGKIDSKSQLDLEHELDKLSRWYVHKRLFSHDASWLGSVIPPQQRRVLFYLLSLMNREYMRLNRDELAFQRMRSELLPDVEP